MADEQAPVPAPQETPDLQASVQSAADSQTQPAPTEPVSSEPASVESVPEGPSQEQIAQAIQIYQALNNPNTAPAAVEFLAKQLGYSLSQPSVQPTQSEAEMGIKEMIAKELGDDYAFLAPKLGGAIENVINRALGPLQQQMQRTQVTNEFDRAMADLNAETKGEFSKHENEIVKVLQRLRPADGVSTKEFLRDAYNLARAGRPSPSGKAVINRINERAQESLPSPAAGSAIPVSDQQTLDAAIYQAAKSLGMVS